MGFNAFISGLTDGYSTDEIFLLPTVSQNPDKYYLLEGTLTVDPYGVGVNKKYRDLLNQVNIVINEIRSNGELKKIIDKHSYSLHNNFERAKESVVRIIANGGNRVGSGFVIAVEGAETYILTSYHNIQEDVENYRTHVRVELYTEERLEARISRRRMDVDNDIVMLIVEKAPQRLRQILWGSSASVKVLQRVYAIGHSLGANWTLAENTISGRSAGKIFFSGNAVQETNSGGPLLDEQGALVGIVINKGGQGTALTEETIRSVIREWIPKVPDPLKNDTSAV
jgi:S1-C subfamily serine protease